jgi:hypothetical protein
MLNPVVSKVTARLCKTEVDKAASNAQLKRRELYSGKEGSGTAIRD